MTVREKDGPPLFAQVITTDNVIIDIDDTAKKKGPVMSLSDANGKRFHSYKFPKFPQVDKAYMEFGFDAHKDEGGKIISGGTYFTITPLAPVAPDSKNTSEDIEATFHFIVGRDNIIVGGEAYLGKDHIVVTRQNLHIVATLFENGGKIGRPVADLNLDTDKGELSLALDGKELGSVKLGGENNPFTMRDEKGEITTRIVTKDGKEYTEFTIGERKVIVEGTNWKFSLKGGVMTLAPAVSSPPASKAPAKTAVDK